MQANTNQGVTLPGAAAIDMFDADALVPPFSFSNEASGALLFLSDTGTSMTSTAMPILTSHPVAVGSDEVLPLANALEGTDECRPSLEIIHTVRRESKTAMEICTRMLRLVFSKEEIRDRNTSGRRAPRGELYKSKLDTIETLYRTFWRESEPGWRNWRCCLHAMNNHISKYVNTKKDM